MITMDADDLRQLMQAVPTASAETQGDTERLRAAICEEPEYDEHENMAGAAVALIERYRSELAELQKRVADALEAGAWTSIDDAVAAIRTLRSRVAFGPRMDKGARANMAAALGEPDLKAWDEIQGAARTLVTERDALMAKLHARDARAAEPTPDAVPVLSIEDCNSGGCTAIYCSPVCRFAPGDEVLVGQWRYRVSARWVDQRTADAWGARLTPLGGAPVQPAGDGLTIARVPIEAPVLLEETERRVLLAAFDKRRLDLAEKMSIAPATWESIATHAAAYGTLSTPVLRFALAMEAWGDAVERGNTVTEWVANIRDTTSYLTDILRAPMHDMSPNDERRHRTAIRSQAAAAALSAMMIAQHEGDLDTFDPMAEIAAARGKSAD